MGQDKKWARGRLIAAHPESDRCILETDGFSLIPVGGVRHFSDLRVGERIYTVGAPRGLERSLGEGIIAGLRNAGKRQLIQTTAPISSGSSGGGLFDRAGNLIGITTFLLRESQSLNFAIAADQYWR